jgi:hypothetical protein
MDGVTLLRKVEKQMEEFNTRMVAPGRVELPTFGLGNRCSIHLSYGAKAERTIIA